jgi:predicted PurR-regulated permease PerM
MQQPGRHRLFIERLLIAAGFALLSWVLWIAKDLVVIVVASVVLAVLLRTIAAPIRRITRLGERASTAVAILLVAAILIGFGWLFGAELSGQFANLGQALSQSWTQLKQHIAGSAVGRELLASLQGGAGAFGFSLDGVVTAVGDAAATLVIIIFGAVFFAFNPNLYFKGVLLLLPPEKRQLTGEAMADAGRALRLWILGQLISMAIVGVLVGLGLWAADVPLPVVLGLVAAFAESIPYLGAIFSSIPGLLVAVVAGPTTLVWAFVVYLAVHQIEGNLLMPVIHRKIVTLPPALTLFFIVAAGLVFGIIGFIFATPLLVVIYVLVKRLYVREALDTYTPVPGEQKDDGASNANGDAPG